MPRFSLIVATLGRSNELAVLLQSLAAQEMRDFEVIVVDQNPDGRLDALLDGWESKQGIALCRLRSAPGVSHARNLGLAHGTGEILAFPDDDCWYPPDTLKNVDAWFRAHPGYGILSLGSRDEQGLRSGNSWFQEECDLRWFNIFRTSATYTYFLRRPPENIAVRFDERIGPGSGTPFGAGEDTDLLISLLQCGLRGRFRASQWIGHPSKGGLGSPDRARQYGRGFGRVLAKHSWQFLFAGLVLYDFARAVLSRLAGRRERARQLWAHGRGMIEAYFAK